MKFHFVSRLLAVTAAVSMAACNGGSSTPSVSATAAPTTAPSLTSRLVGVGDSLTAGYQSGGWLGATNVPNPLCGSGSANCPAGSPVPPGQESGWWAQLWMQANGGTVAQYGMLANPATSVLPLIAGPGLGTQVAPANPALTGGVPFSTEPGRSGCDSFNQASYSQQGAASTVRMNPSATVYDLGMPGATMHNVIAMTGPTSPSCVPIPGATAATQLLQQLLSESGSYYPVMENTNVKPATQLQQAIALKPTLATVWIGANDVLHYEESAGQFVGVDGVGGNTAQVQQDMTTIITGLQNAGAKVVVANLPDVLKTGFFMSVAPLPSQASCATVGALQTYFACMLASSGVPYATADALRGQLATAYGLNNTATGANPAINGGYGYVTLIGLTTTLTALAKGQTPNLDPNGTLSGLGSQYTTPALAAATQALNDTINAGIGAAATATKVPLVDVHTILNDIASGCSSGCGSDPLALLALGGVNPGVCCTMTFGGGLLSFDGIHPSNTGYALIAQAFISTIDTAYGGTIPALSVKAQHDGTGTIPFHDPYAQ